MDEVAQHGESFFGFAFEQCVQRLGAEGACEFLVPLDAGHDGLFMFAHHLLDVSSFPAPFGAESL